MFFFSPRNEHERQLVLTRMVDKSVLESPEYVREARLQFI